MVSWQSIRGFGLDTLVWWEKVVKPGIRKLGMKRSKELNQEKREYLNLLLLRQSYLSRQVHQGMLHYLAQLKSVHLLIEQWYRRESEKIQHQSRAREFQSNEKTTIYHHELHKRIIKRNAILKLQSDQGLLEGHAACAAYLGLLRNSYSTLQHLTSSPSKYFWMRWCLSSLLRIISDS